MMLSMIAIIYLQPHQEKEQLPGQLFTKAALEIDTKLKESQKISIVFGRG